MSHGHVNSKLGQLGCIPRHASPVRPPSAIWILLFLAHERNKGQGSFWQLYLGLLPERPGCAWLMTTAQLSEALRQAKCEQIQLDHLS